MRLESLSLTNFRCYRSECISFSPYTAVLGANNCGKSTIFKAIDLFFRTTQKSSPIQISDFAEADKELRICLTFTNLPKPACEEFSHYYRHGKLEFFMRANVEGGQIRASVHGQRLGIKGFSEFFAVRTAGEKKAAYEKLKKQFTDLPEISAKSAVPVFEASLIEYEKNHTEAHEMIESEDLAFGAAGVAARLKKYVDWVYIPAVKDAADEDEEAKNTAFGTLINRIIRARVKVDEKIQKIQVAAHEQIKNLVDDYKDELSKLEMALDSEFRKITSTNAHLHLEWTDVGPESIALNPPLVRSILSDETFKGDIINFGHGLQRNYLITLVHLNAKYAVEDQPSIILACEEPELYQHPPQARYLHTAMQRIAEADQVIITTHSPYFVSAKTFDKLRVVRKSKGNLSKVCCWTVDQHRQLIANAKGEVPIGAAAAAAQLDVFIQPELSEAFFCGKLVLVEGLEDRAILLAGLERSGLFDEFLRLGCHVVSVNGKGNMINMISISRGFETPYFAVFDGDTDCGADQVKANKNMNCLVGNLIGLNGSECEWPDKDLYFDRAVIWRTNIQDAIALSYGKWYDDVRAACSEWGWDYNRLKKNPAVLGHVMGGVPSVVQVACLDALMDRVMAFARA